MKNLSRVSSTALPRSFALFFFLSVLLIFGATSAIVQPALNGVYTIGPEANYETFADAIADLHSNGISGPVTFFVNPGTYNEQFVLKEVDGASETDTIKFVSATGSAGDVVLTYTATSGENNYIVQLDSADYFIFEKMTFTADAAEYCTIFDIMNGAKHIKILDNVLNGGNSTTTDFSASLIHCDQYSTDLHQNPDSILVSGNTFNNGGVGIYVHGYSLSGARIDDFNVIKNMFNNQYHRAIYLRAVSNAAIKGNVISAATSGANYFGIHVSEGDDKWFVSENSINITSNGDTRGMRIDNADASIAADSIVVANNMVTASGTTDVHGIETFNCRGIYFFHNTLVTSGGSVNYTFAEQSHISNAGPVEIINNIFINESESYAFYVGQDQGDAAYMGTVDYNNYVTSGSNVALWGTTPAADITALQALNGKDVHSISKPVNFVSSTDLHLTGSSLGDTDLIGLPLACIQTDFDGESRSASLPYMGADENPEYPLPVELVSFTAVFANNAVELKWATASETNNFGFDIERRETGKEWQTLAFVEGFGTSSAPHFYSYIDNTIVNSRYEYRLKQIDFGGMFFYSKIIEVSVSIFPAEFGLAQNYPNPFNSSTTISYSLREAGKIQLSVYDATGRLVRSLVNRNQPAGKHVVFWDGKDKEGNSVSSGVYFYQLRTGENALLSKQMILLK